MCLSSLACVLLRAGEEPELRSEPDPCQHPPTCSARGILRESTRGIYQGALVFKADQCTLASFLRRTMDTWTKDQNHLEKKKKDRKLKLLTPLISL